MGISQTAPASMSAEIPENPTFLSGEFRYTNAIRGRFGLLAATRCYIRPSKGDPGRI